MVIPLNPMRSIRLLCLLLSLLLPISSVGADEIRFRNGDILQQGTVVDEDDVSVTIRFPKESIESIKKSKDGAPVPSRDEVSQQSFTDLEERVGELERKMGSFSGEERPSGQVSPDKGTVENPLIERELGSIEGIIIWKGEPLVNGEVMVVMTKYEGSHFDAHKKMFMKEEENSRGKRIALSANTDVRGKYFFEKAPPGEYVLYWKPDEKTGWVRRFRDGADFSVQPGELTVQNIPGVQK